MTAGGNVMSTDSNLPEWDGPAQLVCSFASEKTRTVLYKWRRYPTLTGFYVPRDFLLAAVGEEVPEEIIVVLAKSPTPSQTIGFTPQRIAPRTIPAYWEFDFMEVCIQVIRYDVWFAGQNYPIYVPKQVFGGYPHPQRIMVRIEVPREPSGESG
jgi:hypothetical protein